MRRFHLVTVLLTAFALSHGWASDVHSAEFPAVLSWAGIHVVNFPLDGGISHVHVRPGEHVSKGGRLIELNMEPIAIRVSQYEAEVAAGIPVLADAKRAFEQARSLYEQTVLSDDELQRARHAFEKAGAELSASRARLEYARWQQRMAIVSAPWDAWVVQRDAEPGQMLVAEQRSKPLLVLAKASLMGASAVLPVKAVDDVRVGQKATVITGERTFSARVAGLSMQPGAGEGGIRYRLEVEFSVDADDALKAGQAATIRLP